MPKNLYRNQVRVRICGLLVQQDALLLVKLHSPVTDNLVWVPPGGGLEFGETANECLQREFREETGLSIKVGSLRHINELVKPPFHALEFYFNVFRKAGELKLGNDPEHPIDDQFLEDLQFIPFEQINSIPVSPKFLETQFVNDYQAGVNDISISYSSNDP